MLKSYIFVFFLSTSAFGKEVALTFDDAPRGATSLSGTERASLLINNLKEAGVSKVAFFANSKKLTNEGRERISFFGEAGHSIANHTHSHPEFNKTAAEVFIKDIRAADSQLKTFPNFIKWFRFPMLREGDTLEKRDKAREELERLSYFNAYITVNNYDWHMDLLYQKAKKAGKSINMDALRKTYLQVLMESMNYYDQMAIDTIGRSPKHVLLLHENDLAALFIKDFVLEPRKQGWKIIEPAEAYKDEIATYTTKSVLKANPGRVGEIAHDKKWKGDLWHEACDEEYLDKLFLKNGVYQ